RKLLCNGRQSRQLARQPILGLRSARKHHRETTGDFLVVRRANGRLGGVRAKPFYRSGSAFLYPNPLGPDAEAGPRYSCRVAMPANPHHYGLILAGGRGTRFWPRSRRRNAKQVLRFFGERSLIQQTVDRLRP